MRSQCGVSIRLLLICAAFDVFLSVHSAILGLESRDGVKVRGVVTERV